MHMISMYTYNAHCYCSFLASLIISTVGKRYSIDSILNVSASLGYKKISFSLCSKKNISTEIIKYSCK